MRLSVQVVDHDDDSHQDHSISDLFGLEIWDVSLLIDSLEGRERLDDYLLDEDGRDDSSDGPDSKAPVGEEFFLFGLFVYFRQVLINVGMEVVIDILLVQARVDDLHNPKETVVECVIKLGEINHPRIRVLDVADEHDEGDDDVLPAVKDEEVGQPIVQPTPVVQNQPVQHSETANAEVADCSCRFAFLANDPHPDVSLLNHAHIVAPIADRQHHSFQVLLDKADDFCLFFG